MWTRALFSSKKIANVPLPQPPKISTTVHTEDLARAQSRRIHHPLRPAPYSEKHLFASSHWLRAITVLDLDM